jgi:prepilin-type N-terminal cleavage/methylation domain-containing protein
MLRENGGFSLVELMVVVLIIGVLVTIAVPISNGAKASAQRNTCFASQRTIEGAVQSYKAAKGTGPGTDINNLVPEFLKSVPYCPTLGQSSGTYAIDASGSCVMGGGTSGCTTHGHY